MNEAENHAGEGDLRDNKLAKLALRTVRERWAITETERTELVASMVRIAKNSSDIRAAATAARVLVSMDALTQADEHLADKNKRLDDGKATARVDQQHTHTHTIDYDAIRRRLDDLDSRRAAPDAARDG